MQLYRKHEIADIPVLEVIDQLHIVTKDFKEVRSFIYLLNPDQTTDRSE